MSMGRFIMLTIFCLILCLNINVQSMVTGQDDDDEVIFEKIWDSNNPVEENRKEDVCEEEKLIKLNSGSRCLDLMEILHELMMEDVSGAGEGQRAPVKEESTERRRRGVNILREGREGKNDSEKFRVVDEGPVLVPHFIARKEGRSNLTNITQHSNISNQPTGRFQTEVPAEEEAVKRANDTIRNINRLVSIGIGASNSTEASSAPLAVMEQIKQLLAKLIPLPEQMLADVKPSKVNSSCANQSASNSSGTITSQSTALPETSSPSVPVENTDPDQSSSLLNSSATTSTASSLSSQNKTDWGPSTNPTASQANLTGIINSKVGSFDGTAANIQNTTSINIAQKQPAVNGSLDTYWKGQLSEKAPHFIPKDHAYWWKAEKRREQACVLLSSIDLVRHKCCLTLRLACPEYTAAVDTFTKAPVDGISEEDDAVFERMVRNGGKRDKRNQQSNPARNAFIADTLARISGLFSTMLQQGDD